MALPIVWRRTFNYKPTFVLQWSATFAAYLVHNEAYGARHTHARMAANGNVELTALIQEDRESELATSRTCPSEHRSR
jgi:hypothetical protein